MKKLQQEVKQAQWKFSITQVHALVKTRAAGSGGKHEARLGDALGIPKRVMIGGGGGATLARPGQQSSRDDDDEDDEDEEEAKKRMIREARESYASVYGAGEGSKEQKEAEDSAAADLVVAAAAAAEICVVQADLAAAGSGSSWAPPLEEYVPRAPMELHGKLHGGNSAGSVGKGAGAGAGVALKAGGRVVYNVQLAPGGQRNCVRWMDDIEKLAFEQMAMRKKRLQAVGLHRTLNAVDPSLETHPCFNSGNP
jgi:hypothetical protein